MTQGILQDKSGYSFTCSSTTKQLSHKKCLGITNLIIVVVIHCVQTTLKNAKNNRHR